MPNTELARPTGPRAVARSVLAVVSVALFFTGLDTYALNAWSAPPPVWWVIGFIGAAGVLVLVNPHRPLSLLGSPVALWAYFFLLTTTLWAVWMEDDPRHVQVLIDRYRSAGLLLSLLIILDEPRARKLSAYAVAIGVLLASLLNVAELMGLVTLNERVGGLYRVGGRAAGFYFNPNESALAIVFGIAIVVDAIERRWRLPLLIVGALGVAATFSRGAAICFGLLAVSLVWRRAISVWGVALAGLLAALYLARDATSLESRVLNDDTSARVHLTMDDNGRVNVARKALEMFLERPLAGNGLGATTAWDAPVSSHNIYLNLAGDQGVTGLITFPLLLLALFATNRRASALVLVLLAAGVFSHGLLDQRFTVLVIALAAAGESSRAALPDARRERDLPPELVHG